MLVKVLRFAVGLAIGLALWWSATPAYNVFLARTGQALLRIDPRLRNAFVSSNGRSISISGADIPLVHIPADQLTYNIALLLGLFAMLPLSRRRTQVGLLLSLALLVATHVVAVVLSTESTYAGRLGSWSEERYSGLERDVWTALEYMYRLGLMFAIAFVCWWLSAPITEAVPARRAAGSAPSPGGC